MDESVKNLQEALLICGFSPGKADGMMGPATKEALKKFQAVNGLASDGIVGPKTKAALMEKLAEATAKASVLMGHFSV